MRFVDNIIFDKFGIHNVSSVEYQNFNIIIGENGSGKTRFLKAIREYFSCIDCNDKYSIIYAYFPTIDSSYRLNEKGYIYDTPLYNVIFEDEHVSFDDFLKYIEIHGYDFLEDLLHAIRVNIKYKNSGRYRKVVGLEEYINSIIMPLMNKIIRFFDNDIILIPANNSVNISDNILENENYLLRDLLPKMSPGELMLFYLTIFITSIKYLKNQKLILLLDEPECHLHPKALTEFIRILKNECIFEQCWIATHSIFLLPMVKFNEMVYLNDSTIQSRNSKYYEDIYNSVIGRNEPITQFLLSKYMWQYYEFITECFCLPEEVKTLNLDDEQLNKFLNYTNECLQFNKSLNILDYGGGSGRLGCFLKEKIESIKLDGNFIQYSIYDPYIDESEKSKFIYHDSSLFSLTKQFDGIVIMNVLHEIDIIDWYDTFKKVCSLLKDDGYLLLFDVISLSKGEHPFGDSGFIFLHEKQISEMCNVESINSVNLKKGDKSNFFILQKKLLENITVERIISALNSLKIEIFNELRQRYSEKKDAAHNKNAIDYNTPRKYAFLSQHYINVLFAIESMRNEQQLHSKDKKVGSTKNESSVDQYNKSKRYVSTIFPESVDNVMGKINDAETVTECKTLDTQLKKFSDISDVERIKDYLFNGTQRQKNYAALYLHQHGEEEIVQKALKDRLIDSKFISNLYNGDC